MKKPALILSFVVAVLLVVVVALAAAPQADETTGGGLADSADVRRLVADGARLIDVRTSAEYAGARIPGAQNVPLDRLSTEASGWDRDVPVVVYCSVGSRTPAAVAALEQLGFKHVYELEGGIVAWDGELESGQQAADLGAGDAVAPATSLPVMYEFYTDW